MGTKVIDCIYEKGVFKPLEKVELKEGEKAKLVPNKDRKKIFDKYNGLIKRDKHCY